MRISWSLRLSLAVTQSACLFAMGAGVASALPGGADPMFGASGQTTTDFADGQDEARDIAVQPDGRFVLAGVATDDHGTELALARYDAQGALDPTFGDKGKVVTQFGVSYSEGTALALQTDGKIVAAGFAEGAGFSDFALGRFEPDGRLDSDFGRDGVVLTDFSKQRDEANDLAVQTDGKIVVVGCTNCLTSASETVLARYEKDGTLDQTFGDRGLARGQNGVLDAVAVQPDGRIVTVGVAESSESWAQDSSEGRAYTDFYVARYRPDGALDPSFGGSGAVRTDFSDFNDAAQDVVIQPDGAIVVGGRATMAADNGDFALARYLSNGVLDPTFGRAGLVTTDFGGGEGYAFGDSAHGIALQPDGRIIAVGMDRTPRCGASPDCAGSNFALARYLPGGILDPTFGDRGQVTTDFGKGHDVAWALAITKHGHILVAGSSTKLPAGSMVAAVRDMAVASYLGETVPGVGQSESSPGSGAGLLALAG